MIRIEENKLIIEIESNNQANELLELQDALLYAIRYANPEETEGQTVFVLTKLLRETLPTYEQNKVLFSA